MPLHNFDQPCGRLDYLEIDSTVLRSNTLGDPSKRIVSVYLPEGYEDGDQDYPLLVDIVGFTGSGFAHLSWKPLGESVPQRVDRLVAEGKMGPAIVVFPDCFTRLGGNQYINSAVMGNWADFLVDEMVPALEAAYRVRPGREHRGLFGKSSGGYGSIVHGMLYAQHWGAIACHSGDMDFDLVYRADFAKVLMHIAANGGDIDTFVSGLADKPKISGDDMHTLMILAMAATYDPAPELPHGIRLPVSLETCELDQELWQRWLAWDPIQLVERDDVQQNLRSLRGVFIDCGDVDQYALVFGARQLHQRLLQLGIEHEYQEFPDDHSSIDYRMDISLPFLYNTLTA
jgi:enterochelin esterase-like enzyme